MEVLTNNIMKYLLIFIILFSITKPCLADNYIPYLNLTNKAEWLYDQGKYKESKKCFEDAFKLVKKIKYKDLMVYCKILSQQDQQKKIYILLKNHLKQIGGSTFPISSDIKNSDNALSDKRLKKLDNYLDTTSINYQTELELSNQFERLCELDRSVRMKDRGKDSIWWVSENDSIYVSRYQKMVEIDSLNYIKILELLPKINKLRLSEFYLSRLLIHMNYEHFSSIENQLLEFVKVGILDPWVFARSKDRAYASQADCPIFFTHIYDYENIDCIPLEEIKENRRSIGLSTYYNRPSFSFYIRPGSMMKDPFDAFYKSEIESRK